MNYLNKIISLACLFTILSCTKFLDAKTVVYNDVKDLAFMTKQVTQDNFPKEKTLILFDIDDTLLEAENFVGSGKWYNWQRGRKVFDTDKNEITISNQQQYYCIFKILGTTFELASTKLTQPNTLDIFNHFDQYDVKIITARTAKYRVATERELNNAGFTLIKSDFGKIKDGLSYQFNDNNRTARVTYSKGIIMLSGLNKGLVLADILDKAALNYENIYFIDDGIRNIINMKNVWKDKATNLKLFHYTKVNKNISHQEIKESDNAKQYWDSFLKTAFSEQFTNFSNKECD